MEFYAAFFNEGWKFFYKLCISIISHVQGELYSLDESGDIYICLKLGRNDSNQDEDELFELWTLLIKNSFNIKICFIDTMI